MARIAGVDIPNKHTVVALTYIYGIGRSSAAEICEKARFVKSLTLTIRQKDVSVLKSVLTLSV